MKSRAVALLSSLALMAVIALPVLAATPPGKVTVTSTGCTFNVHIDLDQAYDLVGWKVKEYHPTNWNEGLTLYKGSGPTDADGKLDLGPFTAPAGHYTVAVDDEYPPDGSSIVIDFFLSCPTSSGPTGSEQPIESGAPSSAPSSGPSSGPSSAPSSAPSSGPGGSEAPIAGSPPPTGEVGGVVGTPGTTPPPTDTAEVPGTADANWQVLLVVVAGLTAALATFAPRRLAKAADIARSRSRR